MSSEEFIEGTRLDLGTAARKQAIDVCNSYFLYRVEFPIIFLVNNTIIFLYAFLCFCSPLVHGKFRLDFRS